MQQGARRAQSRSVAEGTFDNYINQWVTYLQFCAYFSLKALPAAPTVLIWFVQHLSTKVKSHNTVQSFLSGVRKLHLIFQLPDKSFSDYILKMTMQGLSRMCQHIKKQAAPVTPDILEKIHAVLDFEKESDAVFWAVCVFAFFLLFRKSNLLPDTAAGFNPDHQLARRDLVITDEHIIVGIRWAKNQQFSRQLMTYPLPILKNSVLCPLKAISRVFRLISNGSASDHIFRLSSGKSYTYRQFQTRLRSALAAAGVVDPGRFSSHSFRRGGATFAFLCGVPAEIIKILGNWKSDAYLQYLYIPLEARLAASQLIKLRIMYRSFKY